MSVNVEEFITYAERFAPDEVKYLLSVGMYVEARKIVENLVKTRDERRQLNRRLMSYVYELYEKNRLSCKQGPEVLGSLLCQVIDCGNNAAHEFDHEDLDEITLARTLYLFAKSLRRDEDRKIVTDFMDSYSEAKDLDGKEPK
jgi:hypothetical protein